MQIKRLVLHWGDPERGNPKRRKRNDSGETFDEPADEEQEEEQGGEQEDEEEGVVETKRKRGKGKMKQGSKAGQGEGACVSLLSSVPYHVLHKRGI